VSPVGRCTIGILAPLRPDALELLHAAGAGDPDLAVSIGERNERRRRLFTVLVRRMAANGRLRPKAARDLVDTLFALTSFWFFSQLATGDRTAAATCRIIQEIAMDAVRRALGAANQLPARGGSRSY
jgi:hypothetical protein